MIARFAKHARAFTPFGFWFGEETAGLKRYVPSEIIFAVWHVEALTPQALAELRELIALSIKAGTWPVTLDEQFWQHLAATPDSVSADPLRSLRATNTTSIDEAVSLAMETHEEEEQAAQELAEVEEESRPPKTWTRRGTRYAAPTLMNGPWRALRWWRPDPEGMGAASAGADPVAWERRIGWGATPEDVHSLLRLVGVPDTG